MRKLLASLVAVLSLSLLTAQLSVAAVTPGSKCTKVGVTSIYKGMKYTCVKSGKKLVWNKGVALPKPVPVATPTPTPTPTQTVAPTPIASPSPSATPTQVVTAENFRFDSLCQKDPFVPTEWASYQEFALRRNIFNCARPYRFLERALPSVNPITALSGSENKIPVTQCKLPEQQNYNNVGFRKNGWRFNGDLQIQVIPVEFIDYKATGSPRKEYGKYLDYIKDMFYKISDGNTRITFRTPESFFSMGRDLKSFVVPGTIEKNGVYVWKKLDLPRYESEIFKTADRLVDFSNIDMTIVLVPLSVPSEYIAHSPEFRMDNVQTNEGIVRFNYLMPPATEVDYMSWFGVEPFLHLHEFFHANGLLNDHEGEEGKGGNWGTGRWGQMSGMLTDFILWDKWIAGMLRDSQVICASANLNGVYWIKPATYFGEFEKMLVIPLSSTRAIAMESQRAAGMNFKLSEISEGVLVYSLDTLDARHNSGITVIRPENRTGPIQLGPMILADAPLKLGDSVTVWGYKISVVESGDFGDVVKVEKA